LFAEARAKYEAALKIKRDLHEVLNNWGSALSNQAKTKQGAEAERLFAEAGTKYEAALKIKPDLHEALNNWGAALSDQAKTKQGAEADRLWQRAREKLMAAEAIQKGAAAYNLACVEALNANVEGALRWLKACSAAGERTTQDQIAADTDFDLVRGAPLFLSFLKTLPKK
jgi:Tfp pilus assembly protein PilF